MKLKIKTLVSTLICMVALICFSSSVFALTDGDWEYSLMGDHVIITEYLGSDSDVTVPANISGCPVTEIFGEAFDGAFYGSKVTKVHLPDTINKIGYMAFANSKNLQSINIPNGVTELRGTFMDCTNLKYVELPNSLRKIEYATFKNCDLSEGISIPDSVYLIGKSVFEKSKIKQISFPDSVTTIGSSALQECENLQTVKLPKNLQELPGLIFNGCTSLERIYIPKSVKKIGMCAFGNCHTLKSIIFPNSVRNIGGALFGSSLYSGCRNLSYVSYPTLANIQSMSHGKYCENIIVYCTRDSSAMKCAEKGNYSYIIDPSVDYDIQLVYNDERVSFDTPPIIENGRTLVPLRAIFEKIGAKVLWDGENQRITATKGNDKITLQIGSNKLYKNGVEKVIDVPAKLVDGRTLVPVRAVAESFDCKVNWIDYAGIVEIQSNK